MVKNLEHENYWRNLKKFEFPYDVPRLPVSNYDEWKNFYVPCLIKAGAIPLDEMEDGCLYLGKCRNATEAYWSDEQKCFIYERHKFGISFMENINHFENDDGYDVFVPIKKLKCK